MFSNCFLQSLQNYDLLLVGFSGGLDSSALLHKLHVLQQKSCFKGSLVAMYVNHGLSGHADTWQVHCQKVCEDLGVDFVAEKIDPKASFYYREQGLEGAARALRRKAFHHYLSCQNGKRCALLLAHHQEDQAETFLLQLFRGAGLKGLSAMPEQGRLQGFDLLRPLLLVSHRDLVAYAQLNNLTWVEDESNQDQMFDRNYLRHQIIPLLEQRWPQVSTCIARSAKHCREAQRWIGQHHISVLESACPSPDQIALSAFVGLAETDQRLLLRAWLQSLSVTMPSEVKLGCIVREVMMAAADKMPYVHWGKHSVRRYRDYLYYMPYYPEQKIFDTIWDGREPLVFSKGVLRVASLPLTEGDSYPSLLICTKQGGERLRLHKNGPSHSLKKLMQEWGMPPWYRKIWPLVFVDGTLVAMPGYRGKTCFVAAEYQKSSLGEWLKTLCFDLQS